MAISDTRGVRHVRCPKCHSVLQEPSAPVYQCGGCGTSLRAKNRTGNSQEVVASAPLQSKHLGSSDVASTSGSTPDTPITRRQQGTGTTTRHETGDDLVSARTPSSELVLPIEKDEHDQSANQQDDGNSEAFSFRGRDAGGAQCSASSPDGNAHLSERRKDGTTNLQDQTEPDAASKKDSDEAAQPRRHDLEELPPTSAQLDGNSEAFRRRDAGKDGNTNVQHLEHRRKGRTEPDAAGKKDSDKAVQPRRRDVEELTPRSAQTADSQSARAVLARGEDEAAAAERKSASSPHHALLQKKILKTVDELRGDLSELFSKSPEFKPRTPARRPPRLPRQEGGCTPRGAAMATSLHDSRARHAAAAAAAAAHHPSYTARVGKPGQVAPSGLPSRRYRRCRADPCCHDVHPRSCHHGCCANHGEPACSSCRRAQVCRPSRAQEPPAPPRKPPAAKEAKRRVPPRNHCRPVLKGAPFIVCSSCFELVQVPADFAVASARVRKLRCGACSAVLSYSYRDPDRKKKHQQLSDDQYSTDGFEVARHARRDPFSFVDDFGHADVSYSTPTEDEQPLHVSRNSSFDTVDEIHRHGAVSATTQQQSARLHRLMGYGSASDLLFRQHSPDLYESFDKRSPTTPDAGQQYYDRKGKGVCVDVEDEGDDDDSDEEGGGALKRSRVRGSGWPLPGILNKGMIPGMGAIRIKS